MDFSSLSALAFLLAPGRKRKKRKYEPIKCYADSLQEILLQARNCLFFFFFVLRACSGRFLSARFIFQPLFFQPRPRNASKHGRFQHFSHVFSITKGIGHGLSHISLSFSLLGGHNSFINIFYNRPVNENAREICVTRMRNMVTGIYLQEETQNIKEIRIFP